MIIDRVKIFIKNGDYIVQNTKNFSVYKNSSHKYSHINSYIRRRDKTLVLIVTGKVTALPNSLGGITKENSERVVNEIYRETGIFISTDIFLKSPITQIDVTEDLYFNSELKYYISTLRELAYKATNKNEIISFCNNNGFEESILIKSTGKTVQDTLSIYSKFSELYSKRFKDNGFYYSLSEEFLEQIQNVLRFERRIWGKHNIIRALHLKKGEEVNLHAVFNCKHNLIKERIEQLFGEII